MFASSSDTAVQEKLNRFMRKATFELADYIYTNLPRVREDLIESTNPAGS